MDTIQLKQIGIWLIIVLTAFGTVVLEWIQFLNISFVRITFLITSWYAVVYMLSVVIYHFFKVKKETLWPIRPLKIGLGIGILVIIGAFGLVVLEGINYSGWTAMWCFTTGVIYYGSETLVVGLIIHYLKIPLEDVPIDNLILTEVENLETTITTDIDHLAIVGDSGNGLSGEPETEPEVVEVKKV